MSFRQAGPDLEQLLKKVIRAIITSPEARRIAYVPRDLTSYEIECAAGNHAFDDYPEVFGITEHEGHCIRAYIQEQSGAKELKTYLTSLIQESTDEKIQ